MDWYDCWEKKTLTWQQTIIIQLLSQMQPFLEENSTEERGMPSRLKILYIYTTPYSNRYCTITTSAREEGNIILLNENHNFFRKNIKEE
mmetsp:Transcript_22499/g.33234  ORF Transcript_22499/g.33234 Transcript_22499/m.33234 type:complete len:89 (+) Transcript_22499:1043-1309(+)